MSPAKNPKLRIFGCPTTVSLWESLALEPEVYKTFGADQLTALTQSACGLPETIELSLPPENSNHCQEIWIIPSPAQIAAGDTDTRDQRVAKWCDWVQGILSQNDHQGILLLNDVMVNINDFVMSIWGETTLSSAARISIEKALAQAKLIESVACEDEECVTTLAGIYDEVKLKAKFLASHLADHNATEAAWQIQHPLYAVTQAQAEFDRVHNAMLSIQLKADEARLDAQRLFETEALQQLLTDKGSEQTQLEKALQQTQQDFEQARALQSASLDRLKTELTDCEANVTLLKDQLASHSKNLEAKELQVTRLNEKLDEALDFATKQEKSQVTKTLEQEKQNQSLVAQIQDFEEHCQRLEDEILGAITSREAALSAATEREQKLLALTDKSQHLEDDAEINELQITHLQEELELAVVDLETSLAKQSSFAQLVGNSVAAKTAVPYYENLQVFDWLKTDSYREAKIHWGGVEWLGKVVDLSAKFVLRDFETQIEIRPQGAKPIQVDWESAPNDEFGKYLLIKASRLNSYPLLQALVAAAYVESVAGVNFTNTAPSDRDLLTMMVADAFFASQPERQPHFPITDIFEIDEHFEMAGYQHIAGTVLGRTNLAPSAIRLKLCILDGSSDAEGRLEIEIRKAGVNDHILPNWPYSSADDFGPLLRLSCEFKGPLTLVTTEVELDQVARQSIEQLVLIIPSLMACASNKEGVTADALLWWKSFIESAFSEQKACRVVGSESSSRQVLCPYDIVAQPGYAHVAFVFLSETVECIVKAQALHHFQGDTAGEPAVEFRSLQGKPFPLFSPKFIETDDYGDLICLRLSEFETWPSVDAESDIENNEADNHPAAPADWTSATAIIRLVLAQLQEKSMPKNEHLPASDFWDRGLNEILSRMPPNT